MIQIPLWLRVIPDISVGAMLAYGTLVWALGGRRKSVSNHSVAQLAIACNVSEKSFRRHLKELEILQLIERGEPQGREIHPRYYFLRHPSMYVPDFHAAEMGEWQRDNARDVFGVRVDGREMRAYLGMLQDDPKWWLDEPGWRSHRD